MLNTCPALCCSVQFWRGSLAEAAVEFAERVPRGEMTLLLAGLPREEAKAMQRATGQGALEETVRELLAAGQSPSQARHRFSHSN